MATNFMMTAEFDQVLKESVRKEVQKNIEQGFMPVYVETKPEPTIPVLVVLSNPKKNSSIEAS